MYTVKILIHVTFKKCDYYVMIEYSFEAYSLVIIILFHFFSMLC